MTASRDDKGTLSAPNPSPYSLVTWNIDYSSPFPAQRLSAILSRILSLSPAVDIIFFQELSREAFLRLLNEPEVRRGWYLSDADGVLPAGQSFTSITLLSKARFPSQSLGPVWRVRYPSHFQRDALCCDIFAPSAPDGPRVRLRLVNVHLDSLAIQPSFRPQQVSIAASLLHSAGRGVVAGDFNPVLPSDNTLVQDNGLMDAWLELHPQDPGFTWGVDGKQPFPPNRMDKVATVGLKVQAMEILSPGCIKEAGNTGDLDDNDAVAWSDHSGLRCSSMLI